MLTESSLLMLYEEIPAVYSEIHIKHTVGQNVDFLSIQRRGT